MQFSAAQDVILKKWPRSKLFLSMVFKHGLQEGSTSEQMWRVKITEELSQACYSFRAAHSDYATRAPNKRHCSNGSSFNSILVQILNNPVHLSEADSQQKLRELKSLFCRRKATVPFIEDLWYTFLQRGGGWKLTRSWTSKNFSNLFSPATCCLDLRPITF